MYVQDDIGMSSQITQWSFLQTIRSMYEGNYGYDYYYSLLDWHDVVNCEEGRSLVASASGTFLPGYECKTDAEIVSVFMSEAEQDVLDWFWDEGGCQAVITRASALSGYGAARIAARIAIRRLIYKKLENATDEQTERAVMEYLRTGDAVGAMGLVTGIVVGTVIEDAAREALRKIVG